MARIAPLKIFEVYPDKQPDSPLRCVVIAENWQKAMYLLGYDQPDSWNRWHVKYLGEAHGDETERVVV